MASTIFAAEAVGVARECTDSAAAYAKERQQFGRPIATFQAVKHHCANMLVATELATAAVWDAARAASAGGEQFSLTSAMAASLAMPAADLCANLNVQVHGGIGFTWEHDAHLYLRRAAALERHRRRRRGRRRRHRSDESGVRRTRAVDLPPEAEAIRDTVPRSPTSIAGLDADESAGAAHRDRLRDAALAGAVGPRCRCGRATGHPAGVRQAPACSGRRYGITGWVILTLIQHATEDQVARWVRPALSQDVIWCQLFSEPDAGSDAAGIKTARHPGRWRLARQRAEGLDERGARRQAWLRHRAHEPRRAEAQRDHDDGHRHGGRGRRGPTG